VDIRDYILEHLVQSGKDTLEAQKVLNLRKVCKTTKSWVDSKASSVVAKIFLRIPFAFEFEFSQKDLEEFDKCRPPPRATSIIVKTSGSNSHLNTPFRKLAYHCPKFIPTGNLKWNHWK